MITPQPDLDYRDAWVMRIFVILYGAWCALYLVDGFVARVKRSGRQRLLATVRKSSLFLLLGVIGLYVMLTHSIQPLLKSSAGSLRSWVCMVSIGHALYCAVESLISYKRMPLKIIDNKHRVALSVVIVFGIIVAVTRTILNIANIACQFGKQDVDLDPKSHNLDVATTAFNVAGSAVFCLTELYVWYLTKQISRMTNTAATIRTMQLLANANLLGSLAGFIDIADQYLQLETLEVLVLGSGMTALCYYGKLLGIDTLSSDDSTATPGYTTNTHLDEKSINVQTVVGVVSDKIDV